MEPGVAQLTEISPSPNTAVGAPGVSGRASGRAGADDGEGSDSPTAFTAITENVYSTSLVRPSRVQVVDAHEVEKPCGDVTRYSVIAEPLLAGAVHDSTTVRSWIEVTEGVPGASGRP